MITKEEVKHIAKLARLGLTEKELKKHQKEFSKILDYIEKLKEVDASEVELTAYPRLVENVMRKDEASKFHTQDQKLIDGFLKVKSIL